MYDGDGINLCEKCGNYTTGRLCRSCQEQEMIDNDPQPYKSIQHSEDADWAIANLMNCIGDGSVDVRSKAHTELTNAINTYLIERGFTDADLADLWNGEIQLTSS